jgi:hypothetical protein
VEHITLPEITVEQQSSTKICHIVRNSPFSLAWVTVPDDVAPHFLVTDLRIRRNSQLLSAGAVPASLFAESQLGAADLEHTRLLTCPAKPGDEIVIDVTNTSSERRRFSVELHGWRDSIPPDLLPVLLLGYGNTLVKGEEHANVSVQPQVPTFRPFRLHVPPHVLDDFEVQDVFMNPPMGSRSKVNQSDLHDTKLRAGGRISLEPIDMPFLTIAVWNRDSKSHFFNAVILGSPT